jgi:hypothetical protein
LPSELDDNTIDNFIIVLLVAGCSEDSTMLAPPSSETVKKHNPYNLIDNEIKSKVFYL